MLTKEIVIRNKMGFHARPSALLAQIANKFNSNITIEKDGIKGNAKRISDIMFNMVMQYNDRIKIYVEGEDEAEAMLEVASCIEALEDE